MFLSKVLRNYVVPRLTRRLLHLLLNLFLLHESEVCTFEGTEQFLVSLGGRSFFLFSGLSLGQDLIQVHLTFVLSSVIIILEQVSCSKLDDGVKLLLAHTGHLALVLLVATQHPLARGVHVLDDQMVQHHLVLGLLDNILVHTVAGNKSEDLHFILLTNPVSPGDGLKIILRIEI